MITEVSKKSELETCEYHLGRSKEADKDPKQSSPTADCASKSGQQCFCIGAELCVDNFDSVVECNAQSCPVPFRFIVQKICGIFVCLARSFAIELVIVIIQTQ